MTYYPDMPVSSDNIGLVGWSNAGNTSLRTAGFHADGCPGLSWILNWESPVGDGLPQAEAGAKSENTLRPFNSGVNPAYDPQTGDWDFSNLKWDPSIQVPLLGGGGNVSGSLYIDEDQDEQVDRGTDFIFYPLVFKLNDTLKAFYSERLHTEALNRNLFPAAPPDHIPDLQENKRFWRLRNGEYWIETVVENVPDLFFMVVASDTDHVQVAPDHPHILNQYNAFLNTACRFVRLNPDRSYVESLLGYPLESASDNDAGMHLDRSTLSNSLEPGNSITDRFNKVTVAAAGACELADRVHWNNSDAQIDPLTGVKESAPAIPDAMQLTSCPNPFNSTTRISYTLNHSEHVQLDVYNIRGQHVQQIFNGYQHAGSYSRQWSAEQLPSGIYLIKLKTDHSVLWKPCTLVR
ncbi:MAG: T9SS type A sorting domain-containing protein [candidate division KSB1 bacterium]|nr:T9SS type A sorting domain-containing protein [candidate division KSB1 bacterium]